MAITNAQQARQLYQFGGGADMGKERGTETGREPGPVGGGQGVRGDTPRGDGPATGAPSQGLIGEIRRQQLEKAPDIVERQKFNVLDFIPGVGLIRRLSDILPPGGKPFDAQGFGSGQGGGPQAMVDIPTWMRLGFSSEAEYLASLEDEENKEAEESLRLAFRADGGPIGGEYDFESARQMYGLGKLVKKVTRTVKKIAKSPVGKAALIGGGGYLLGGGIIPGVSGKFLPFAKYGSSAGSGFGFGNILPNILNIAKMPGLAEKAFSMGTAGKALTGIAAVSALAGLLTAKQEEEAQELSRGEGIDIDAARRSILARAQGNIPGDFRATAFRAEGGRIGLRNGGDDDDADDQESSYDDGPLLIPDDADLSPDDFYGRKEREGIMKMASAPDPMDSLNDMAQMLFGKNLDQLTDEEYIELLDAAREGMSEGGSMKEPVAKKTMPLLDMGGKEMDLREEGGFVPIGRMEKADDVPARLSKNEFVFTADAVRNAGDGDVDKGAEVMYNMMKNLEAGGEVSEESQGLEGARKMFQTSQRLEEVL